MRLMREIHQFDPLAGMRCTCPPGCTTDRIGDGERDCSPSCEVCIPRQGLAHKQLFPKRT